MSVLLIVEKEPTDVYRLQNVPPDGLKKGISKHPILVAIQKMYPFFKQWFLTIQNKNPNSIIWVQFSKDPLHQVSRVRTHSI